MSRAEYWPWSSTRAQLAGENDATVAPLRALISDFAALLAMPNAAAATTRIERASTIGRPLGRSEWVAMRAPARLALWQPAKRGQKLRVERDTAR